MKTYTVRRVRQIETLVTVQAVNEQHAILKARGSLLEGEYDARQEAAPDSFEVSEGGAQ